MQSVWVISIVGLAVLYLARRAWRTFSNRGAGCGCERLACPSKTSDSNRSASQELVELKLPPATRNPQPAPAAADLNH